MKHEETKGRRISLEEVNRIAELARLSPSEDEREQLAAKMSSVIDFVEQLNELDTTSIEPLHHVLDLHSVLRDDVVRPSLPVSEVMKNAPQKKGDYFIVPRVIKGAET